MRLIVRHVSPSVSQVHRLVVVDEQEVVRGIVSLSDILQALVLTDAGESSRPSAGPADSFPPRNVRSGFRRDCVRSHENRKRLHFSKGRRRRAGRAANPAAQKRNSIPQRIQPNSGPQEQKAAQESRPEERLGNLHHSQRSTGI